MATMTAVVVVSDNVFFYSEKNSDDNNNGLTKYTKKLEDLVIALP